MRIARSIELDATADQTWEIVGHQFAGIATWAGVVATSRPLGPHVGDSSYGGRVCRVDMPGRGELVEELTSCDDEARTLTYRAVEGLPRFVQAAISTWTVEELPGGRSRFTMASEVQLGWVGRLATPFLLLLLGRLGSATCRDLRTHLQGNETGSRPRRISRPRTRLDRLVGVNAIFSLVSACVLLGAADWWAAQFADVPTPLVRVVGIGLVAFAGSLAFLARRGTGLTQAHSISLLDAMWVLASIAVIVRWGAGFTGTGRFALCTVALAVGSLGWLQWTAARENAARAS